MDSRKARILLLSSLGALALGGMALAAFGGEGGFAKWQARPDEPFTDGEAAFRSIYHLLKERYVDADLSEDELYRAASQGILQYADAKRTAWNRLYTPTEYAELLADLRGEVVGIGLDFRFEPDSGMGVVNEALAGTPAAAAGLKRGDRILQVDGRSFAGRQQRDMVYAIRGRAGTAVTLTMLREASVFPVTLTREPIALEESEVALLDGGIVVATIRGFSQKTSQKIADGLRALPDEKRGLIVDLRGCPGGSFEAALATVSHFLPRAATITRVRRRGGAEEVHTNEGDPLISGVPVSVLIDGDTSSGCELAAAALKQSVGATLVGAKTFGKWSMQSIEELPNKYAAKFTVAAFFPPDGSDLEGKGLEPDVPVTGDAATVRRLQRLPVEERLRQDPTLQAARSVLD